MSIISRAVPINYMEVREIYEIEAVKIQEIMTMLSLKRGYNQFDFIIKNEQVTHDEMALLEKHRDGIKLSIALSPVFSDKRQKQGYIIKKIFETSNTNMTFDITGWKLHKDMNFTDNPIQYINYKPLKMFVQKDGMMVVSGLTGSGKTQLALEMLDIFAREFDKILYLNYELTGRDLIERYKDLFSANDLGRISTKLISHEQEANTMNLIGLINELGLNEVENLVIILDNADSAQGEGDNVYSEQRDFVKVLDSLVKRKGWHAVVLNQIIKDNNIRWFDREGFFVNGLTTGVLGGSKVIGDLARTTILLGYHELQGYQSHILKKGSALYWSEVKPNEQNKRVITGASKVQRFRV